MLKELLLNSAILTIVIKIVWTGVSLVFNKIRSILIKRDQSFLIPLEWNNPLSASEKSVLMKAAFYCLIVRYGTDNYIRDMANEQEKFEGQLQNRIIPVKVTVKVNVTKSDRFFLEIKLPVHKRIGTQFKCFATVKDDFQLEALYLILEKCKNIHGVSKSSSQFKNRVYFLLKDFETVKTVDGIENNMCFPV